MFAISDEKKNDFWATLANDWKPKTLTPTRMKKLRTWLWNDARFWDDIVARHGGLDSTCEQIKNSSMCLYNHMLGNFHSWCFQALSEHGVKIK